MKSKLVKDLMIPLSEYAVVSEDDTLYEAVLALEEAQEAFEKNSYIHRAILVKSRSGDIIGKVTQLDVLMGLEPKYKKIGEMQSISNLGFSKDFLQGIITQYGLWEAPLEDICRKASKIIVKNIMYTPTEGEFVEYDATMDQAIHQLVMGKHQSLLVTQSGKIAGILRLVDVFKEIFEQIKTCRV
ncbi:MAG: CBS domain-containing protein [Desulfobacterales bacterium]|jgi:predicted transcriptional regulator|nr:CBS domain-containing protein [Desulfobacterales bacterium]